jgi:hypothetical protein
MSKGTKKDETRKTVTARGKTPTADVSAVMEGKETNTSGRFLI